MTINKAAKARAAAHSKATLNVLFAEEDADGFVTATVAFPDGLNQSVRLPAWATKDNIKDEALRIRNESETKNAAKTERQDLKD